MIFPKIWRSDRAKILRGCTIFSAIPRGSEHRYVVPERRTCGEVEEGVRGVAMAGWEWRWYLCNPGTASWEMVREARACIPGHVPSQARLTYTYTLAQRLIARIPRIDLVHNHQFRIFPPACAIFAIQPGLVAEKYYGWNLRFLHVKLLLVLISLRWRH